ncbi:hypothetical protein CCAND95_620010 [Capnocytophaga canis]|uniref:Uncharacterized protein n=1 Tax=Capnocytophaga canis TaxID=1848903 RepID=A0A0B7I2K6_9FLAO|nr:hypothetical protein CCAND95_620010 [Capnocytophaga canis]CEN53670.1 hypothetical protein CCAND93_510011 [Capnocytophaga canis]
MTFVFLKEPLYKLLLISEQSYLYRTNFSFKYVKQLLSD